MSLSPWVIDSGSSVHKTDTSSVLSDISPIGHPSCVTLSDGVLLMLLVLAPIVCVLLSPYRLFYMLLNIHLIFYLSINLPDL